MPTDKTELFTLLEKWVDLLPSSGDQNLNSIETLKKVGLEIQHLCAEVENAAQYISSPVPIKKEPEADFKPSFIFQLATDQPMNTTLPQFACVFDFCTKLTEYCETLTTKQLNIETDWLKLLLACSSHNYDRFMWIHLTFQSANNLKLDWSQVRRRLMSKFDDPSRQTIVFNQIANFKYIPEIETIEMANERFTRLTEEAQIDGINYYVNVFPLPVKEVLISTIDYDASTNFHCDLKDVMQRATVFLSATDDDFTFYSKSAHLAVRLEHEKVNQKDCEFHLLAEHSTSSCPDYIIVKYPYMEFTPLNDPIPTAPASYKIAGTTSASAVETEPIGIKNEIPNAVNQPIQELARRVISEEGNDINTTTVQVIKQPATIIPLSNDVKEHLEKLKEQTGGSSRSNSRDTRREEPESRKRSRSPVEHNYRERSVSPEIGCYIHGTNSSHTTKDCRQAQMVIPARHSNHRSISPNPNNNKKARFRKGGSKENICIFCGLIFKPGHLSMCKKVPNKQGGRRS
ncbi:hypothetical protein INT48_000196 [Thamnidium elegans]|uniref:Uncharacterized protein n=1 Tax=Thamnidium elegans TaxID=101142 RepID=A0A8H7SYE6_9FUNG|nr:hypothetical protein INT48_000196 [Thamnidium elegans]